MAATFAFAESRDGALRKVAYEAVTAARQAAEATGGGEVHALVLGAPGIAARAEELGRYGADLVVVVEHPALERYSPEVAAATAEAADPRRRLSRGLLPGIGAGPRPRPARRRAARRESGVRRDRLRDPGRRGASPAIPPTPAR